MRSSAESTSLPDGAVLRNPPANVVDTRHLGLIPGLGRSPGVENGNQLLYSYLENSMDRKAWQATVHVVDKSETQLGDWYEMKKQRVSTDIAHKKHFILPETEMII